MLLGFEPSNQGDYTCAGCSHVCEVLPEQVFLFYIARVPGFTQSTMIHISTQSAGPDPDIVLPIPYFGVLPPWFGLFLDTCAHNSTVSWKFFTDAEPPADLPGNVEFIGMTLQEFSRRATDRLGFEVDIAHPYKLCDFKPLLGLILADDLGDPDFWGFSDCDVFYGDFRKFMTADLLSGYDVLSTLNYRLNGPLTLMRNVSQVNELAHSHPHVEKILNRSQGPLKGYSLFDELLLTEYLETRGDIRVYYDDSGMQQHGLHAGAYFWNGGRLVNVLTGRECMYYHFNRWKRKWPAENLACRGSPAWLIHQAGVFPVDTIDTSSQLQQDELSEPYKRFVLEKFGVSNPDPSETPEYQVPKDRERVHGRSALGIRLRSIFKRDSGPGAA